MYLGDVNVGFGKLGINEITHPVQIVNGEGSHTIGTDWISPYQAGAMIDGVPSENHYAVGGNHGTDGGGGHATANTVSTTITADGKAVDTVADQLANKVVAEVVNEVTLKENIDLTTGERLTVDFVETVTYTFERNHMQVSVDVTAINPMYIHWYMGLQSTNVYFNRAYFTHDIEKPGIYTYDNTKLDSGTKAGSPNMERATMLNASNEAMHVYTDKDYGIGYDHIGDTDVIAYLRENNLKFYYHLVKSGNRLMFAANETNSYKGGYIFGKVEGTNAFITRYKEGGVSKALVDFRQAGSETISYTSIEESVNVTGDGSTLTASTDNAYAKIVI